MKTSHIIKVGNQELDLSTPVVMTILNATSDSFWEGSRRDTVERIAACAEDAATAGAAIIDIGGYSTRPGAPEISPDEEFERVARALETVRINHPEMIVSIDTFRAAVARRAVENFGPCIINDISAGDLDPEMIPTVARLGVPYIAMHMRGTPATMQQLTDYENIADEVIAFFDARVTLLRSHGIRDIIVDPGFGFAKTTQQNYQLMARMHELLQFGHPILSGISRKSMIYKVLGNPPADTLAPTCALNWESLRAGASILRVHDTREAADIIRIFNCYRDANPATS